MCPVSWAARGAAPRILLQNAYDYRVDRADRRSYTLRLGGDTASHALLTGPNRGGKSTTLRGIVASLLLAHTYGAAMASQARLTPFRNIRICLTPEDLPGSKSRFEREIEFTASTLNEKGATLVLVDELYHSTNPPDAERACRVYTEALWRKPSTLSVISTHLFEFVKDAPKGVLRLCCPASVDEQGVVHYSYRVSPGVCEVSSVDELLVENGLLAAPKQDAEFCADGPENDAGPE
jgi:DNA mismatch repair ATPase MutS